MHSEGAEYFRTVCMKEAGENITCEKCEYNRACRQRKPEIIEGNRRIWQLLDLCRNQWRMGYSGQTGFDFGVAIEVARSIGMETDMLFFRKLRVYETTVIGKLKGKGTNAEE